MSRIFAALEPEAQGFAGNQWMRPASWVYRAVSQPTGEDNVLRRTEPLGVSTEPTEEPVAAASPEPASPSAANRPATGRPAAADGQPVERRRGTERRESDRRGMDRLRAEALQNVISMVEDRNFGGLRNKMQVNRGRRGIPASRLLLLVIALAAGGLAAYLTLQQPSAPAPVAAPEIVQAPMSQVLVARGAIDVGQRLTADLLQWVDWPESAVQPDFITNAAAPDAVSDMSGDVARYAFFPGEPIREAKLSQGGAGFLSAILDPGTRAVSVQVQAASSSGGFIAPKDRVDVVLTRSLNGTQVSQTILTDVRVLAINGSLGDNAPADGGSGDPSKDVFENQAIATLALDPSQAQVIINASGMGSLSLVLRPTAEAIAAPSSQSTANAEIRMTSPFWIGPDSSGGPR